MKAFYEVPFLSIDTETTGIDPFSERVVTMSMVVNYPDDMNRPDVIKEWLINPGVDIPESAAAVHGVTNEMAQANGVVPEIALAEIATALTKWDATGNPVVIFNSQFDATLLRNEFDRNNIDYNGEFTRVIDPYVLDRFVDKWRKGKRTLEAMSEHYGVTLTDAHNSSADSIAAAQILRKMGEKHSDKLNLSSEDLFVIQQKAKKEQAESMQKYFTSKGQEAFVPTAWPFRTLETDALDKKNYGLTA
ncbi:MAG: 3'-5' exonuclease [Enterococcus sp.]|nr:3'-5' exonuclease [Enterococcus sp.]